MMPSQDLRYSSPSALRNRGPIFEVLREILPASGTVLEIASGTGEHVVYFAGLCPTLIWQPSDLSSQARASIQEWINAEDFANVLPPLDIDTSSQDWPVEYADTIIAINMVHISPWSATLGLLKKAGELLPIGGALVLYGPYRREGQPLVASNAAFDADLRARNSEWGIRQLEDVVSVAEKSGLTMTSVSEMPANNLSVIFKRQ